MKKTQIVLIVLCILIVLGAGFFVSNYNSLVQLNEKVTTQHSNISIQLERRADLIPNLVKTVKTYASHEKEVFENLAKARQAMISAGASGNIEEQAVADTQMTSALGRLFAISEAYPDLKSNENFIRLQDELAGTENRIAVARRDYNEATRSFNTKIKAIPGVFFASFLGYTEKAYFEAKKGADEVPQLNF